MLKQLSSYRRPFVILILGICIGASIFLFVQGKKVTALLLERDSIYYANNQKYKEIVRLQNELDKYATHRIDYHDEDEKIQKITAEIMTDELIETQTVKEHVEQLMEPFLNKSMQWISSNPELVAAVLDNKIIPVKEQRFAIHVKYLSFYHSILKAWITIQPEGKNSEQDPKK